MTDAWTIGHDDAAERVMAQVRRHTPPDEPELNRRQVAAVLHALADHTALVQAVGWKPIDELPAVRVGRWLHDLANYVTLDAAQDCLDTTEVDGESLVCDRPAGHAAAHSCVLMPAARMAWIDAPAKARGVVSPVTDLHDAIGAALDHEQALAEAATTSQWFAFPHRGSGRTIAPDLWSFDPEVCIASSGHYPIRKSDAAHIAAQDPARTMRRLEADRRVLARHVPAGTLTCAYCSSQRPCPDLLDLAARVDVES